MSTILKHFCLKLFAMKIETRIKELRLEKELTQSDLAKAISTSQRNIGRWENGENEPTASFLIALADYFKVSIDYLLCREDEFGNIIINK